MEQKQVKHEDVIQYVLNVQNGETECYNILFKLCGQLITHNVKKYVKLIRHYNLDVEDFRQHLNLSFIECVNKFPKEHKNFIAYAFTFLHHCALQFLPNDYEREERTISLNVANDKKDGDEELLDSLVDENALQAFEDFEDNLIRQNAKQNIRNILSRIISNNDIDLLYDIYGLTGTHSLTDLCKKYNLSMSEIICWERLIILTIQTYEHIDTLKEQLYTNVTTAYNYSYARWKYTRTSSTEHIAIKNIYIENKIEQLKERVKTGMKTLHKNIANANPNNDSIRITPQWKENVEKYNKYKEVKNDD